MLNWSVSRHLQRCFGYNDRYPLVAIGEFLRQSRDEVIVQDDVEYKQLTVKTKGEGLCLRGTKRGRDIGTKRQWQVRKGQFVLSKIDARNGAMGIVPEELNGAIVTHDFPLFDIDLQRINPQFLLLITTTAPFMQFAQSCSSGTTNRQRINVDKFLQQRIPLPSIEEQNYLVEKYNGIIRKAEQCEQTATRLPQTINEYLRKTLRYSIDVVPSEKGLKFIRFKDISRWDYQYYNAKKHINSYHKLVTLNRLISRFLVDANGLSLRCNTSDTPRQAFTYIGMENVEKDTGRLLSANQAYGNEIKSQSLRVPEGFILYGKLRPYLNKYWLNIGDWDNIVCSSEFFVFDINDDILKEYFICMLASDFVQEQICDATSGARMPRINEATFRNIVIPFPPLSVQQEIAAHVSEERAKAKALREEATRLRHKAIAEFERQIFASR